MRPSKMRNRQIWQASHSTRSRQLGAALSDELRSKHSRRSVRVVVGDTVRVVRGEYKDVDGKVSRVFTIGGRLAIEGVKKEKGKGEKFDVQIHSTNVVVTSLNGDDSRRMARIRGERGSAKSGGAGPEVGAAETRKRGDAGSEGRPGGATETRKTGVAELEAGLTTDKLYMTPERTAEPSPTPKGRETLRDMGTKPAEADGAAETESGGAGPAGGSGASGAKKAKPKTGEGGA